MNEPDGYQISLFNLVSELEFIGIFDGIVSDQEKEALTEGKLASIKTERDWFLISFSALTLAQWKGRWASSWDLESNPVSDTTFVILGNKIN